MPSAIARGPRPVTGRQEYVTSRVARVESLAARIEGALDRRHRSIAIILCAAWLAGTMASAISKPFWHDELYTILVARLPSLGRFSCSP